MTKYLHGLLQVDHAIAPYLKRSKTTSHYPRPGSQLKGARKRYMALDEGKCRFLHSLKGFIMRGSGGGGGNASAGPRCGRFHSPLFAVTPHRQCRRDLIGRSAYSATNEMSRRKGVPCILTLPSS